MDQQFSSYSRHHQSFACSATQLAGFQGRSYVPLLGRAPRSLALITPSPTHQRNHRSKHNPCPTSCLLPLFREPPFDNTLRWYPRMAEPRHSIRIPSPNLMYQIQGCFPSMVIGLPHFACSTLPIPLMTTMVILPKSYTQNCNSQVPLHILWFRG